MTQTLTQPEVTEREIQADNIPAPMTAAKQWILWRYELKQGTDEPTKVPYQVNGHRASSIDPMHWVTFGEALAALYEEPDRWHGVGFVFTPEDNFIGIDLDDCLEADGTPLPWAAEIIQGFATYTEVSPSGTGLKLFFRGDYPLSRGRKVKLEGGGAVEVYTKGRYFTVTGQRFSDDFAELQTVDGDTLGKFADHYFTPINKPAPNLQPSAPSQGRGPDIIHRAQRYAMAYPAAISGQGGHDVTFRLACVLVNGFELDPGTARAILEGWNLTCQPPWSSRELDHKIQQAQAAGANGDRGYMLQDGQDLFGPNEGGADTTAITSRFDSPSMPTAESVGLGIEDDEASDFSECSDTFPPELLEVPGFVGEVADWITTQNPRQNRVLSLVAALALQGQLIGRKVKTKDGQRSNLYMVCLAPSGGGKQAPIDCVQNVLSQSGQSNAFEGRVSSDSAIASALVESPAILLIWDEVGRFLNHTKSTMGNSHLQAIQDTLLELWGKTSSLWKHKAMADRRMNREIDQPCVSVLGMSVPSNFWGSLEESHLTDGFAARFMVVDTGPKARGVEIEEAKPPRSILDVAAYWRDYRPGGNLSQHFPEPTVVLETDEARAAFKELTDYQDTITEEPASSICSRMIEKAKRLALIFACSRDHEAPVIDEAAAKWGVRFAIWTTNYFLKHAKDEVTPEDEFNKRVKKVYRYIKKRCESKKAATWTVMLKSTKLPSGGPMGLQAMVAHLLETKQIEEVDTGKSGRDKIGYRIAK